MQIFKEQSMKEKGRIINKRVIIAQFYTHIKIALWKWRLNRGRNKFHDRNFALRANDTFTTTIIILN